MLKRILIVDDEESMRHMLSIMLKKEGYEVETAANGRQALEVLEQGAFDAVLCDIRMPDMDGVGFLAALGRRAQELTVIMMSAFGTIDTAIEAMKLGAYDYVSKPFKSDEIILTLRKAEERERLRRENARLRSEVQRTYGFDSIVGKSAPMQEVFRTLQKVSGYKSTVLLMGESGTGKELIARAIHYNSPRRDRPFVAVNCGAIPENLLESELFGHLKGAFTDASRTKKGLFEEAHEGTLFLDEIGELPLALQVKLLRVLQEEEIRRVGDVKSIKVDVRVIAATVKDLEKEVKAGRFREDLYYRLNVLPIHVPPLRQRKEDIPALVEHFIKKYNARLDMKVAGVAPEAMALLMEYDWPGNVRELENTIERALVLTDSAYIQPASLPPAVREFQTKSRLELLKDEYSIKKSSRILEEELIRKALAKTRGNRTHAAKLLEISHRALLYKIAEYGIEDERQK
ncbi:MAG TPA: sigma-54 dependent transcriptional regulator [Thermodesulfobacteriota bacterium]|nr:sigma-54 dependent transcriptional regulator [Thermodesulfobacteriota bacterium]